VNKRVSELLATVARRRAETTLAELFDVFELPEQQLRLEKIGLVQERLEGLSLILVPGVERGELDTVRTLRFFEQTITATEVLDEVRQGETGDLELKTSLLFDHKKARANPKFTPSQLRSEEVLYSTLKTVGAFLTSGGGVLCIGVDDSGNVIGISHDFMCMTEDVRKQNSDGWQLHFRNQIRERFQDGDAVNDYIACQIVSVPGSLLARVSVSGRRKLSFLRRGIQLSLYRRQGNRTVEVKIDQVEEFMEFRRELGLSLRSDAKPNA
jgi:predicted HTH transcriptional regulator